MKPKIYLFVESELGTYGSYRDVIIMALAEGGTLVYRIKTSTGTMRVDCGLVAPPTGGPNRFGYARTFREQTEERCLRKFPGGYELVDCLDDFAKQHDGLVAALVAYQLSGHTLMTDPNKWQPIKAHEGF